MTLHSPIVEFTTFRVEKSQLREMRDIGGKNEPYRIILDRLLRTYRLSNRKVLPGQ
jgi:hypothetical protein